MRWRIPFMLPIAGYCSPCGYLGLFSINVETEARQHGLHAYNGGAFDRDLNIRVEGSLTYAVRRPKMYPIFASGNKIMPFASNEKPKSSFARCHCSTGRYCIWWGVLEFHANAQLVIGEDDTSRLSTKALICAIKRGDHKPAILGNVFVDL